MFKLVLETSQSLLHQYSLKADTNRNQTYRFDFQIYVLWCWLWVFFLPSLQWDLNTSSFRPFSGQKISKTEPKITAVINCHFFRRDWVSEWMMCCYYSLYLCIPTNCWAFELLHSEKPEICQCHRSKTLRVIKVLNKRAWASRWRRHEIAEIERC